MARTKGGKQLSEHLLADLADLAQAVEGLGAVLAEIADARRRTRNNPQYVEDVLDDMRALVETMREQSGKDIDRLRRRIDDDLTKMLQRAERNREQAAVPERLTAIEAQVAHLARRVHEVETAREGPLRLVGRRDESA